MDAPPAEPAILAMVPVRIPAGTVDGSIVVLEVVDGTVTAEVCIPGPPRP